MQSAYQRMKWAASIKGVSPPATEARGNEVSEHGTNAFFAIRPLTSSCLVCLRQTKLNI